MSVYELDTKQFKKITEQIMRFADGREAERIINDYLYGEGADILIKSIQGRLPESGRKPWTGKAPAAKHANPLKKKTERNLEVTIYAPGKYHYLYFPDDGSNTIHHVGNQQFMFFGADAKAQEIADNIVEKLVEELM